MEVIRTFPKFTVFYVLLMALEIAGLTVIPTFHIVSKALIVASLIGFYITVERRQSNAFLTGLIFALLGDCFLLFETDDFFTIGLICFLIMQVCYTLAFNKKRRIPKTKDYVISAGIGVLGLSILAFLWSDLQDMKIPVTLYAIAITTMAIYAYLRHPRFRGYATVLVGVMFFIVSDALLAVDRFGDGIASAPIVIMVTYMIAQYLIVTGEVIDRIQPSSTKENPSSAMARHRV